MTPDARIERIESRQEVHIRGTEKLIEVAEVHNALLQEIVEWTQIPPSTELGDTLRALLVGQQSMHGTLVHLGAEVRALVHRVTELERRVSESLATSPA